MDMDKVKRTRDGEKLGDWGEDKHCEHGVPEGHGAPCGQCERAAAKVAAENKAKADAAAAEKQAKKDADAAAKKDAADKERIAKKEAEEAKAAEEAAKAKKDAKK